MNSYQLIVLNLVINGIPSIQNYTYYDLTLDNGFKPCYKWNTFNTGMREYFNNVNKVEF